MENLQLVCAVCKIGFYSLCCRLCGRKPPPPRPEFSVLCIGLDSAGKTTILTLMCGESTENIEPTSGFNVKPVRFAKCIVNVKELGGSEKIRPFWHHYFGGAAGVVFVLDGADSESRIETACEELHRATQNPQLRNLPLLILANCSDKPEARSEDEVRRILEVDNITGRKVFVKITSKLLSAEELARTFEEFNQTLLTSNSETNATSTADRPANTV